MLHSILGNRTIETQIICSFRDLFGIEAAICSVVTSPALAFLLEFSLQAFSKQQQLQDTTFLEINDCLGGGDLFVLVQVLLLDDVVAAVILALPDAEALGHAGEVVLLVQVADLGAIAGVVVHIADGGIPLFSRNGEILQNPVMFNVSPKYVLQTIRIRITWLLVKIRIPSD